MPPVDKKRPKYTQQDKDRVFKMREEGKGFADIEEETGITEMTLRGWERDRKMAQEQAEEASAKDQLEGKNFELDLLKLQNKHLRKYAKVSDEGDRKEVEIDYLLETIKLFDKEAQWNIKRLSEIAEEEEDD